MPTCCRSSSRDLADTVHLYVTELKTLASDKRDEIKERNREIAEGVYDALNDPKKTLVPPKTEDVPPYLNFAPLEQASDDLTEAAQAYDKAFDAAAGNGPAELNSGADAERARSYRRQGPAESSVV